MLISTDLGSVLTVTFRDGDNKLLTPSPKQSIGKECAKWETIPIMYNAQKFRASIYCNSTAACRFKEAMTVDLFAAKRGDAKPDGYCQSLCKSTQTTMLEINDYNVCCENCESGAKVGIGEYLSCPNWAAPVWSRKSDMILKPNDAPSDPPSGGPDKGLVAGLSILFGGIALGLIIWGLVYWSKNHKRILKAKDSNDFSLKSVFKPYVGPTPGLFKTSRLQSSNKLSNSTTKSQPSYVGPTIPSYKVPAPDLKKSLPSRDLSSSRTALTQSCEALHGSQPIAPIRPLVIPRHNSSLQGSSKSFATPPPKHNAQVGNAQRHAAAGNPVGKFPLKAHRSDENLSPTPPQRQRNPSFFITNPLFNHQ